MNDEPLGRPRSGRGVRGPPLPADQPAGLGVRVVGGPVRHLPVRIRDADSRLGRLALHGNRLVGDPGVHVLEPGAPRRSLPAAHPFDDGEAVHAIARGNRGRHPGARRRERLREDERPARASVLPADDPSGIACRGHRSQQGHQSRRRGESVPAPSDIESRKSSASTSRTGAGSTTGTASSATATT